MNRFVPTRTALSLAALSVCGLSGAIGCGESAAGESATADESATASSEADSESEASTQEAESGEAEAESGTQGDGDGDGDADSGGDGDGDGDGALLCPSLPPVPADAVQVSTAAELLDAVGNASAGQTIALADGTYALGSQSLVIRADGVTLRSASGDRDAVVIDGNYEQSVGGLVAIYGPNDVTVADLTLRRARYHLVHNSGGEGSTSVGTRLINLHLIDPGEQAIKVNGANGEEADQGELACTHIELTDAGRAQVMSYTSSGSNCYTGGLDAHRAQDWHIHDNRIENFWCSNGDLSEHGIHLWRGARDTVVERNYLLNNARGIGFGLGAGGSGRTYTDAPCGDVNDAGHYGGVIRNNIVLANDAGLLASPSGMDLGIGLEGACGASVVHNSVASTGAPTSSSIEWRFASSDPEVINNLTTHNLKPRDGAVATEIGNMSDVAGSEFVDLASGDAHTSGTATAVGAGDAMGLALAPRDIHETARPNPPTVGADEP